MVVQVRKKSSDNVWFEEVEAKDFKFSNKIPSLDTAQRNCAHCIGFALSVIKSLEELIKKPLVGTMIYLSYETYHDGYELANALGYMAAVKSDVSLIIDTFKEYDDGERGKVILVSTAKALINPLNTVVNYCKGMLNDEYKDGFYCIYSEGEVKYALASHVNEINIPELKNKSFQIKEDIDDNTFYITFEYEGFTPKYHAISRPLYPVETIISESIIEWYNPIR